MNARTTTVIERDLLAWFTHTLDIRDCSRVELTIGLLPGETAGMRPETWPAVARNALNKHSETWLATKTGVKVRAITYGAVQSNGFIELVIVIHYEPATAADVAGAVKPAAAEGVVAASSPPPAFAPPDDPRCKIAGCGE